jgi:hypothetical protein
MWTVLALLLVVLATARADRPARACFILHEIGVGEVARGPDTACRMRVSPQSTFKVPHALAAPSGDF